MAQRYHQMSVTKSHLVQSSTIYFHSQQDPGIRNAFTTQSCGKYFQPSGSDCQGGWTVDIESDRYVSCCAGGAGCMKLSTRWKRSLGRFFLADSFTFISCLHRIITRRSNVHHTVQTIIQQCTLIGFRRFAEYLPLMIYIKCV